MVSVKLMVFVCTHFITKKYVLMNAILTFFIYNKPSPPPSHIPYSSHTLTLDGIIYRDARIDNLINKLHNFTSVTFYLFLFYLSFFLSKLSIYHHNIFPVKNSTENHQIFQVHAGDSTSTWIRKSNVASHWPQIGMSLSRYLIYL